MDELEIINKYFRKLTKNNSSAIQLNDDVFFDKKKGLAISVDAYNEGVHFPNFKFPDLVIKKIIRSSISDLIAKGVRPNYYFISASGNKRNFTKKNLNAISKSLQAEQRKFNIKLSGGDTTYSNNLTFSLSVIGYTNKIVERNKSTINDDIYVTGNIGDSYLGLKVITKKINLSSKLSKYFIKKFYKPDLPYKICNKLNKIASSSIDVSDGIFSDMSKLINNQRLSFEIDVSKIPLSTRLKNYLIKNNKKKINYISKGDDYQILFTAPVKNRFLIKSISKRMNQKITKIGKIIANNKRNTIKISNKSSNASKFKGYYHKF